MTSRKFELCTKKKRWRPARRDSIKAKRRDERWNIIVADDVDLVVVVDES